MLPTKPRQLLSLLARVRPVLLDEFLRDRMQVQLEGRARVVAALYRQLHQRDEQGELVRRDKLAFVKSPLHVLQEIELAPVAGRSGHLPLPLRVIAYTLS
jgi:hypothetical protein